jgi:hypothetical protein
MYVCTDVRVSQRIIEVGAARLAATDATKGIRIVEGVHTGRVVAYMS